MEDASCTIDTTQDAGEGTAKIYASSSGGALLFVSRGQGMEFFGHKVERDVGEQAGTPLSGAVLEGPKVAVIESARL